MKTLTLAIVTALAVAGSAHAMGNCSGSHTKDQTAESPAPKPIQIPSG